MMKPRRRSSVRPGVAAVWALVVIAIVTATAMAAATQFAYTRKQVSDDRNRVQALWLARSGFELAADRLMANPDGYTGETVKPIPGGEIKIVVRKHPKKEGVYQIESEARYRDGLNVVVLTDRRALKLYKSARGARVEVVANDP